jgi:hypothetical protein
MAPGLFSGLPRSASGGDTLVDDTTLSTVCAQSPFQTFSIFQSESNPNKPFDECPHLTQCGGPQRQRTLAIGSSASRLSRAASSSGRWNRTSVERLIMLATLLAAVLVLVSFSAIAPSEDTTSAAMADLAVRAKPAPVTAAQRLKLKERAARERERAARDKAAGKAPAGGGGGGGGSSNKKPSAGGGGKAPFTAGGKAPEDPRRAVGGGASRRGGGGGSSSSLFLFQSGRQGGDAG